MITKELSRVLILLATLSICFITNLIATTGIVIILGFYSLVYCYNKLQINNKYPRYLYHILLFILFIYALAIYQHLLPGFNNVLIFDKIQVSKDATPFTMYFNVDKALTGFILLFCVVPLGDNLNTAFKKAWYLVIITILLLMGLAVTFNFVKVDYKFYNYFFIWGINNLLIVAMAEEVLFRGLLQGHLSRLNIKYSQVISIVIPALCFGALHWKGGLYYVIYATIAGIMYCLIYHKSKNIIFSILNHFVVNLIHIIFFTYPFLK